MKLMELNLNWADSSNAERPHNFDSEDYTLLICNISDVFSHTDQDYRLDLDSNTGGSNAIGNRLDRATQHFQNGNPMDPPEVAYSVHTNNITFTNGRHRSLAAYQMGEEYIPMFVYSPTIEQFKKLVRTKS